MPSPKRPDRLRGSHSVLLNAYHVFFRMLRLRMSLAIPPFLYAFMSCKEATLSSINAVILVSYQTSIVAKGESDRQCK